MKPARFASFSSALLIGLAAALGGASFATAAASDIAVVYFSRAENTEGALEADSLTAASLASRNPATGAVAFIAQTIARETKADLFSLRTAVPYPKDFDATVEANRREASSGAFPALRSLPSLSGYRTVYLGFPIWSMAPPRAVGTFLRDAALEGKTVHLFCSNDGYGPGSSFIGIRQALPRSRVTADGLAVHSRSAAQSRAETLRWLQSHRP